MPRRHLCVMASILAVCSIALTACSNTALPQKPLEEPSVEPASVYQEGFLADPKTLSPVGLSEDEKLRVIATTNIVADVVANIGGDAIELTALIPLGSDPHTYQLTPGDYRAMAEAHVIFINGLGLEETMYGTLEQIATEVPIVSLSEGVELRQVGGDEGHAPESDGEVSEHEGGEGSDEHLRQGAIDPHVWFDPINIMVWAENAAQVMGALDPTNVDFYEDNAHEYIGALEDLDAWIEEVVAQVPEQNRELITDHLTIGYFAHRYGFEMIGAVIPAYSTAADPSAQELAALEDTIRELEVRAVFVGMTVNPRLVERVAEDTGVRIVPLYTGSLSESGGLAETYLEFMKYNVDAIVEALRR
jgi:manganese/iron transport system substrate-binding protein